MEKLIELLNEYHFSGTEYVGYYLDEKENRIYFRTKVVDKGLVDEQRISDERIISKKFGFIKRLVENDKIDLEDQAMQYAKSDLSKFFAEWKDKNGMSDDYAMLLMLLAIQDEPIKFLISILK